MDLLDRLLLHDESTTSQLLARCALLPAHALDREHDAGHRTLRHTFAHMIDNVATWTALMRKAPLPSRGATSIATLTARHEASYAAFAALARAIHNAKRQDDVWLDTRDSPPTEKTYGGAILHVITHNAHHRAELLHMLHRTDDVAAVPACDLMSWDASFWSQR